MSGLGAACRQLIGWVPVGTFISVLVGVGWDAVSMTPPEAVWSKISFAIAYLLFVTKMAAWLLEFNLSPRARVAAAVLLFAVPGALFDQTWRLVDNRATLAARASSAPAVVVNPEIPRAIVANAVPIPSRSTPPRPRAEKQPATKAPTPAYKAEAPAPPAQLTAASSAEPAVPVYRDRLERVDTEKLIVGVYNDKLDRLDTEKLTVGMSRDRLDTEKQSVRVYDDKLGRLNTDNLTVVKGQYRKLFPESTDVRIAESEYSKLSPSTDVRIVENEYSKLFAPSAERLVGSSLPVIPVIPPAK